MSPDDEKLVSILRDGLSQPDMADGGFTARVLASLPPSDAVAHYRSWLVLGWTGGVTGVGAALWACIPRSAMLDASSALGEPLSGLPVYAWTTFALVVTLISGLLGWYLVESARES
jgi:hypothetical protein